MAREIIDDVPPMTPVSETMNARKGHRLIAFLWVTGIMLLAGVLYFFNPADGVVYPVCVFHSWTGMDCPGCGSLRAAHALMHGQLTNAWDSNPLFVILLPWAIYALWKQYRTPRDGSAVKGAGFTRYWFWVLLVVLVVFGVIRNLPMDRFRWMAAGS